ncbi:helix-turn-helix domain-containing protein [Actinokineospora sp. G85]|uniref:helix-turn-helix domain-containing protein n=1 Tax=Actinokineospora sp. G85 TaxID=3406626 RepID=UPI003C789CA6
MEFNTVGRWERGELTPQPWRRKKMARELGVSLDELATMLETGTESQRDKGSTIVPFGHADPIDLFDDRFMVTDARASARFSREVAAWRTDEGSLMQVEHDIARFAAEYVTRPLADLLAEIRQVREQVFGLLRDNRHPNQLRRLYVAASRASGLLAHVCLDRGKYEVAQEHADTAFSCADQAGHHGMRAWVRGLQSLIAYWNGQFGDAMMYASDGSRFTTSGSVMARLPSLEARACAAVGDRDGTVAALGRADAARAIDTDDDVGVFTFPAAKQAVYAGTALLTLRDRTLAEPAIHQSSSALALYAASEPANQSSGDMLAARLDLAAAHLVRDDLDAVVEQLAVVLVVPQARRTASIMQRAGRIGAQLSGPRYGSSTQGRQMRAEVTAFCAPPPALPGSSA